MNIIGNPLEYFIVFGSGVLVSFTPCVYPLLPITASFIAGTDVKGSKWMGLFLSLVYVLGIAISYSILGAFAALTGKIFGQLQNNPYLLIFVANILIVFSLVMFDIIHLPTIRITSQQHVKPKNLWAVVLFGMASGLVIGPCVSPVLGTILGYIAGKQNIFYGSTLMFVFAYGMGASLILVGTFSGILANLPKSGTWLVRVKQFCGLVLLIIAQYYLVKAGGLF